MHKQLQQLFEQIIKTNATDVHFNFSSQQSFLQFRTLNGLYPIQLFENYFPLYQYLKYLAKLDLASTTKPQSGVFQYIYNEKEYYCRFSAIETFNQKSGVLRILNLSPINKLADITSNKSLQNKILKITQARTGLVLFAGSTGSGKSTSMFTLLESMTDRSVYTLEDPIERICPNIMQIQINEKSHLDFQEGIKQLLRHDPDVIVLGEIRSEAEALAAIRCCFSGHLVMSTIHSPSAALTIGRLLEFNVGLADLKILDLAIIYQQLEIKRNKRQAKLEVLDFEEVKNTLKQQIA